MATKINPEQRQRKVSSLLKDFYALDGINVSKNEAEKMVSREPTETVYELTQKALDMATKLMEAKGVKNMMSNPIMSSATKSRNDIAMNPRNTMDSKTPKSKVNQSRDPNFTTIAPSVIQPLKTNDSIANILGKMYNFMIKKYQDDGEIFKEDEKYKLKLSALKETRIEELISLFGGKYTKKTFGGEEESKNSFFGKLLKNLVVGAGLLLIAKSAFASVKKKIKDTLPEIPNFSNMFGLGGGEGTGTGAKGGESAGNWKNDTEFLDKVNDYAKEKGIKASDLLSVMAYESGIDPSKRNPNGGATGLIQFMPKTAKELGTTTNELAKMSRSEQFEYVKKYFELPGNNLKPGATAGDIYTKVFLPARSGSEVLTRKGEKEGYYEANKGLDIGNKGYITKSDLQQKAEMEKKEYDIQDVETPKTATTKLDNPNSKVLNIPQKQEIEDKTKTQSISVLNNNTNIINGGTTFSMMEEFVLEHSPFINKQYYS